MKNSDLSRTEILETTQDFQKQVKGGQAQPRRTSCTGVLTILVAARFWQAYELFPDFPELQCFLEFWQKSLEGVLHSVTVAHSRLVKPVEIKTVGDIFRLH
jgi:uncharacterized protein Usg